MSKMPTRVTASGATLPGATLKTLMLAVIDALNSYGYQEGNRSTVTTSSTLTITQAGLVLVDCTSGNVVLTLPASGATVDDALYMIRRIDNTANTLTVQRNGADTVEGAATGLLVGPSGVLELQMPAGATNWRVLFIGGATNQATRENIGIGSIGLRNVLINGAMKIDQRNAGAAQTFTAAAALAYCVDRWYGYCTGANVTGARVAVSSLNRYRFTGAASVTGVGFGQRMEAASSMHLAGLNATLQAKLSSSSLTSVGWALYYANSTDAFGTLASPTRTSIASGTFTINSSEATYSAVIAVPAAATTGLELVLTGGALLAAQTLTIGDVQLEQGAFASAPPFENRPLGAELALGQRYYEKSFPLNVAPAQNAGVSGMVSFVQIVGASTLQDGNYIPFKATKRTASPSVVFFNPSAANAQARNIGTSVDYASTALQVSAEHGVGFSCTSAGATAAGGRSGVHYTADAEL